MFISKKRSGTFVFLLMISMLATMFAGWGSAGAAAEIRVAAVRTFAGNAGDAELAAITIYESADDAGSIFPNETWADPSPISITVRIMSAGVYFRAAGNQPSVVPAGTTYTNSITPAGINAPSVFDTSFTFTVKADAYNTAPPIGPDDPPVAVRGAITINLPVTIQGADGGPIEVEIYAPETGISAVRYTLGNTVATGSKSSVLNGYTVPRGTKEAKLGQIRIEEGAVHNWTRGTRIWVDLPADMTYNAATVVAADGGVALDTTDSRTGGTGLAGTGYNITTNAAGNARLEIAVKPAGVPDGSTLGAVIVTLVVDIEAAVALGEAVVSISGNSDQITAVSLPLSTVRDADVKEAEEDPVKDPAVTPAPTEVSPKVTVFTIGSTTYTVDGVERSMDVAPYIKDSRTYVPIRYAAYTLGIGNPAVGAADPNILWNDEDRTVTLMKGDSVVQLEIGSTQLITDGAVAMMDVAPEIMNGRTMLPVSWVADAFGYTAGWDAVTQQVTISQQ